jgi:hypothetical protein
MPVRRVRQLGVNIIGAIPSRKLGRMVRYESLLERAAFHLLEQDAAVVWYEEQPCRIRYRYRGRKRVYTPDIRIEWRDGGVTIAECKPLQRVGKADEAIKWTAARAWCDHYGARFTLITEQTLRPYTALLENLRMLRPHAHTPHNYALQELLLRRLTANGGQAAIVHLLVRDDDLQDAEPLALKATLWRLLYDGVLDADLTRPLDLQTTAVRLPSSAHVEAPA